MPLEKVSGSGSANFKADPNIKVYNGPIAKKTGAGPNVTCSYKSGPWLAGKANKGAE